MWIIVLHIGKKSITSVKKDDFTVSYKMDTANRDLIVKNIR